MKTKTIAALCSLTLALTGASVFSQEGKREPIINTNVPPERIMQALQAKGAGVHPRLFADAARFEEIKEGIKTEPQLRTLFEAYKAHGDSLMDKPSPEYVHRDGGKNHGKGNFLNSVARVMVDRMEVWGFLYRVTGERKYVDRAWKDLDVVCGFPDWHASPMLVTGEMSFAVGLAYDWLYDALTLEQRATLLKALAEKAFAPALIAYRGQPHSYKEINDGWLSNVNNFSGVVPGGLGVGALAVMDQLPEAAEILSSSLVPMTQYIKMGYEPNGGGMEGPMYWTYGAKYIIYLLAAMDSALGTDFGLSEMPGLRLMGDYALYTQGATGRAFNYSDSGPNYFNAPFIFWLAEHYQKPAYGWAVLGNQSLSADGAEAAAEGEEAEEGKEGVFKLLWAQPSTYRAPTPEEYPLARLHQAEVDLALFKSAWNDRNALFFGMKGGRNRMNHGQIDIGTFVLENDGVRWAVDLGLSSYKMPGAFDGVRNPEGQRWTYYRNRAEGHNTLVIDNDKLADQEMGVAPFTAFSDAPTHSFAVLDMSEMYAKNAKSVRRGVRIVGKSVLLQDEVDLKSTGELHWFMHTEADIKIINKGKTAVLQQDGKTLYVQCRSPADAGFTVMDAAPLPGSPDPKEQKKEEGVRKLAIVLKKAKSARIVVGFSSDEKGANIPSTPLADWK